jgi:short-subunit dehydrogenase
MHPKVILITGCSSGIGKSLALKLHNLGHKIYATSRNRDAISELANKLISTEKLDVTNDADIDRIVPLIMDREVRIDILINNAGYGLIGPIAEIPDEEIALQFNTNLFGQLKLIKKIIPIMKMNSDGLIVNIGSISGLATTPFSGAYCASKSALHSLSDALRMEVKPFGIKVVTVQPGGIKTNFGAAAKQTVERIFKADSIYAKLEKEITARAEISQLNATSLESFTDIIVKKILLKNPPPIIRTGNRSFILPIMKLILPTKIYDNIMIKKFGLSKLS